MQSTVPHLARALAEKRSSQVWQHTGTQPLTFHVRRQSTVNQRKHAKLPIQSAQPSRLRQKVPSAHNQKIGSMLVGKQGRNFNTFLIVTTSFGALTGLYCFYLATNWRNSVVQHANSDEYLPFNADVSSRWKELGRDFDDEVEMSEKLMSMKSKRRRLVRRAYGTVLEVSAGTGRNLEFYDLNGFDPTRPARRNIISHLTLNDQSEVIIAAAEEKVEKFMLKQEKQAAAKVNFVIGDAGTAGIIQRPEGGYDTIVQTMGVCSMVDPVGFLKRMGRLCRQPGEKSQAPERLRLQDDDGKGGQILLLEHGRGHFDWLNWVLDTGASLHAHRFGCWWNKDIEQIVKQSGLEIEQITRYHGGTTWMIVLRPKVQQEPIQQDAQVDSLQMITKRRFGFFG